MSFCGKLPCWRVRARLENLHQIGQAEEDIVSIHQELLAGALGIGALANNGGGLRSGFGSQRRRLQRSLSRRLTLLHLGLDLSLQIQHVLGEHVDCFVGFCDGGARCRLGLVGCDLGRLKGRSTPLGKKRATQLR